MATIDGKQLEAEMDTLPARFQGPGGVAAVISKGQVVARRAWGFSDLDEQRPMTPDTRLPICSISKQFTCAAMLAVCEQPEVLDLSLIHI